MIGSTGKGAFHTGLEARLATEPAVLVLRPEPSETLEVAIDRARPNSVLVSADPASGFDLAELHRLARTFPELVVVNLEPESLELLVDCPDLGVSALLQAIRALLAPTSTPQRPEARILAFTRPPEAAASDGAAGAHDAHLRLLVGWVAATLAARLVAATTGLSPGETAVAGWGLSRQRALALLCPEGEPSGPAEAERWRAAARARLDAFEAAALMRETRLPLVAVEHAFALGPEETLALRIVLAGELDSRIARVMGFLNDDMTMRRPTLAVLGDLVFGDGAAVRQCRELLDGHGNLARYGLLALAPADWATANPLAEQPVVLPADLLELLFAGDPPKVPMDQGITIHAIDREAAGSRVAADALDQGLAAVLAEPSAARPIMQLEDGAATRRRLLDALSRQEVACVELDLSGLTGAALAGVGPRAKAAARVARRHRAALLLLPPSSTGPGESVRLVQDLALLLHDLVRLLIIDSPLTWHLAAADRLPACWLVERRLPTTAERCSAWRSVAAAAHGITLEPDAADALGAVLRFERPDIEATLRLAAGSRHATGEAVAAAAPLSTADLQQASRRIAAARAPSMVQPIEPTYRWHDIALPDEVMRQLREIPTHVRHAGTVLEEWGFERRVPYGQGVAALFAGVSGTGKTMAAQIVAAELGVLLFHVDLAQTVSKYIGETEKQLDRVFREAETASACILFDECESIFAKRTEVKDAHDRYANLESAFLLQRLESFRGLAILTTNLKQNLDTAFIRRLRFVVDFPTPDATRRERIWRQAFPEAAGLAADVDVTFLARRFELTGGHIQTVAMRAAFLAAAAGERIAMRHVVEAARAELVKLGMLQAEQRLARYAEGFSTGKPAPEVAA
jgi:hypothetical protein